MNQPSAWWIPLVLTASLISGCSEATKEPQPTPENESPTKTLTSTETTSSISESKGNLDPVKAFIQSDSFCSDVVEGKSLEAFLAETPSASKDVSQSRPDIEYAVYVESMFMYEFLDGKMFAIRYVVPRSEESAEEWIEPYRKALGVPTNADMPQEFRDMKARNFLKWDLPEHDLNITFTYLPSQSMEADLDLFGFHVNSKLSTELLARVNR